MKSIFEFKNLTISTNQYLKITGGVDPATKRTAKCTIESEGGSDCQTDYTEDDCNGNITYSTSTVTENSCF